MRLAGDGGGGAAIEGIRDSEVALKVAGSRFRTRRESNNSIGSCNHGPCDEVRDNERYINRRRVRDMS